jgi:hypothetical protein
MATLISIPVTTRQAGSYTFPAPNGNQFTIPATVTQATFIFNISLADKLSAGKHAEWLFEVSADNGAHWQFAAGAGWTSYGPGGFTNIVTGAVNPDPTLTIKVFRAPRPEMNDPGKNWRGWLIRGGVVLPQSLGAGVTITTS